MGKVSFRIRRQKTAGLCCRHQPCSHQARQVPEPRAQSRTLLPPPSAWFKAKPSLHLQLVTYQKKINAQGVTKSFLIADVVITAIPPDLLFSAVQRASVG